MTSCPRGPPPPHRQELRICLRSSLCCCCCCCAAAVLLPTPNIHHARRRRRRPQTHSALQNSERMSAARSINVKRASDIITRSSTTFPGGYSCGSRERGRGGEKAREQGSRVTETFLSQARAGAGGGPSFRDRVMYQYLGHLRILTQYSPRGSTSHYFSEAAAP